jgi:hypothetical protein
VLTLQLVSHLLLPAGGAQIKCQSAEQRFRQDELAPVVRENAHTRPIRVNVRVVSRRDSVLASIRDMNRKRHKGLSVEVLANVRGHGSKILSPKRFAGKHRQTVSTGGA